MTSFITKQSGRGLFLTRADGLTGWSCRSIYCGTLHPPHSKPESYIDTTITMLKHSLHSHTPCYKPQAQRLYSTSRKLAPFLGPPHRRSDSHRHSTLLIRAEGRRRTCFESPVHLVCLARVALSSLRSAESSSGKAEDKDFEDKLSKLKTKAKTPVELVRESKGEKHSGSAHTTPAYWQTAKLVDTTP